MKNIHDPIAALTAPITTRTSPHRGTSPAVGDRRGGAHHQRACDSRQPEQAEGDLHEDDVDRRNGLRVASLERAVTDDEQARDRDGRAGDEGHDENDSSQRYQQRDHPP
jgi:hypothetical protein